MNCRRGSALGKVRRKKHFDLRGNRDDREMPGGCADGEKCECHA